MIINTTAKEKYRTATPSWLASLRVYQKSLTGRSIAQVFTAVVPFVLLWAGSAVIIESALPDWLAAFTIVAGAFFMIRTFIVFHDCCHGSFLPKQRGNRIMGYITGVLTFTAYGAWRWIHLRHHATTSQLDHRGLGDIWMMTFAEYRATGKSGRFGYRLYRHPLIHFFLGPLFLFVIVNRFTPKEAGGKARVNVAITNLALILSAIGLSFLFGIKAYLIVQLSILWLAGILGVWLFYVQHQFDPGYWERDDKWNRVDACLQGASYYKLPKVLNWLTGSIGLHHIHHLFPRIPNYRLVPALKAVPEVQLEKPLTIRGSMKAIRFNIWNESEGTFMSFREARRMLRAEASTG